MPKTKPCVWCGKPLPAGQNRKYHTGCAPLAARCQNSAAYRAKSGGRPTVCLRCGKTFLSIRIRHFCPECNLKP
ncbi:MAG: hypothetical protein IJ347_09435 [Faecalibacterium sp.]|nr:hypothetical protein [Faecalibacterium sp.]